MVLQSYYEVTIDNNNELYIAGINKPDNLKLRISSKIEMDIQFTEVQSAWTDLILYPFFHEKESQAVWESSD